MEKLLETLQMLKDGGRPLPASVAYVMARNIGTLRGDITAPIMQIKIEALDGVSLPISMMEDLLPMFVH